MPKVYIVWGEDSTVADNPEAMSTYKYNTEAEMRAFLDGVEEGVGWFDHRVFGTEQEARDYIKEVLEDLDGGIPI